MHAWSAVSNSFVTSWTAACQTPVHGISPARILEWAAISSSRGSSWARDQTHISCNGRWIVYHWATFSRCETSQHIVGAQWILFLLLWIHTLCLWCDFYGIHYYSHCCGLNGLSSPELVYELFQRRGPCLLSLLCSPKGHADNRCVDLLFKKYVVETIVELIG